MQKVLKIQSVKLWIAKNLHETISHENCVTNFGVGFQTQN